MNKILFTLLLIGCSFLAFSQRTGINYQAVILNPNSISMPGNNYSGQPLIKTAIELRFSLINGTTLIYKETQSTQTDEYGLINVTIGKGQKMTSTLFDDIAWTDSLNTLQVELKLPSAYDFIEISRSTLQYSPFALYAKSVDYLNIKGKPTGLSYFKNDAGLLSQSDLATLRLEIKNQIDQIIVNEVPLATDSLVGKIKLSGDLSGKALAPLIKENAITPEKILNGAIHSSKLRDSSVVDQKMAYGINPAKVGLGLVNNTADVDKPISLATQNALDLKGGVKKVNGLTPNSNGEITISLNHNYTGVYNGGVFTLSATPEDGDVFIVSTDPVGSNNGRTFIYVNTIWNEITNNISSTDARYVQLAGSTLQGDLNFPSGKKVTIIDLPISSTDAANKGYVDASQTVDATATSNGKIRLSGALTGSADNPEIADGVISNNKIAMGISATKVGLSNVDNTSDIGKPISTAMQTALDLKASISSVDLKANTSDLGLKADVSDLNLKAPLASPTFTGSVSGITATMVALGNVNNTSDLDKPISAAMQTALDLKASNITLALKADRTDLASKADITDLNLKAPIASPTFTGIISGISATMVGLSNVDNTSDINKPIGLSTQTALDLKANSSDLVTGLALKAGTASPTFTGIVSGITPTMVGLANVNNTSDANKPISLATQVALDLKGTVKKVNGISPNADGEIAITLGRNYTGLYNNGAFTTSIPPVEGDIFIVSGDPIGANNGRTFIFVSTAWNEITNNIGTTDARYVQLAGSTMLGNLNFPTGKKIILTDLPVLSTDAANKSYVDAAKTLDATSILNGKIRLAGDLTGTADNPTISAGAITDTKVASGINPTKVGLGNVNNTSDLLKPISSATQTALDAKASNSALALKAPLDAPTFTGNVSGISKSMVGLNNVDNTTDLSKPISSATQSALDLKASITALNLKANTTDLDLKADITDMNLKAPLASPTFSGTVSGITKTMVGLSNAENTSDLSKPISTATLTALNLKVSLTGIETITNKTLTAPTLTAPVLGTPVSGNATNLTGLPLTTGVTGTLAVSNGGTGSTSLTGIIKGNGSTNMTAAINGTDFSLVRDVTDEFTANVGQTAFILTQTKSTNAALKLFINGVRISKTAFSLTGTSFTYIPANNEAYTLMAGDRIQIDYYY